MTMSDLFNDVPAFVAVVESGSFAAAGKRLHLSRSAVGKAVARLEERLGARLFQRTTRSQNLTDDGQAFYEHCQQAITALQAGKAVVETGRKVVSGRLRITMPVLYGRLCAAPILMRLARTNPELILELDFRDHHVDLIESGMDLAVRNGPVGTSRGLVTRHVAFERTLLCAAPSYIDRCGSPASLDDLTRHEAIVYSRDGRVLTWQFQRKDGPMVELIPATRLLLNDLATMLDAVVAGQGISLLPHWLVEECLERGALIELLPNEPGRIEDIHLIWPQAPHLPVRVRVAIEALLEGLADARRANGYSSLIACG